MAYDIRRRTDPASTGESGAGRKRLSLSQGIFRQKKLGRLDEALAEAQQVDNYYILEVADILCEQGHEAAAEHLIEKRVKQSDDTNLLKWRGRENYRVACQYLTSMRKLYQKFGRSDAWTQYIAALRERNRNLPALKDELAKAKL